MRVAFAVSLLAGSAVFAADGNSLPQALPLSRYQPMMEESPFALATPPEVPTAPKESFAANWLLTGLAKLKAADGVEQNFVTIRSRDQRLSFTLLGDEVSKEAEAEGVTIASVDWSPALRKSTVMLKKGTEMAKVEFSQEATAPPAMPMANPGAAPGMVPRPVITAPGAPGVSRPGQANAAPGIRPVMPQANAAVPRPAIGGVPGVPGMSPNTVGTSPVAGAAGAPQGDNRRRIRIINSK